ncbi:MAG: RNA-binding transcriptional accessory protein [Acidobacteria bacterium]|nr:RNA-binding transcriptional accessory protein [Acidobacteriota bacterium]
MPYQVLPTHVLIHIAQAISVPMQGLVATIALFDEGGTVPFIARYRKEATGNLDEVKILAIQEKLEYHRELAERKVTVLDSIKEQGKLTPELQAKIEKTLDKSELEDLYLPYKPKRRTKASVAREKGLEPLALYLWEQKPNGMILADYAASFVNTELGVASGAEALEGARHIVAEMMSENAEYRKALRQQMMEGGRVSAKAIPGMEDPEGKYKMYADFSELAKNIPSHRMLAIRRGAKEGILHFEIDVNRDETVAWLRSRVVREPGEWERHLAEAIEDGYDRLLNPSIQTEIRLELKDRSDEEAIRVFRQNLENLLLAPPAGQLRVIGIDPGIRTGCKVAVVDDTGKILTHTVIYPLEPKNDVIGSARTLSTLIQQHGAQAIAIGNGTGSREVSQFLGDFLRQAGLASVFQVTVSEAGASVYSASDIARQEFPDLDLTVRGAISIARRLQDPLAELVKVDPKSIGVGQYQHDVDQRKLKHGLEQTVESCVNRVGVDLNTASWALLRYVAGVNERTAQKIVEYRNENGRFRSRTQLMAVPGFGPKTFEQAAGFLRIRGGENPLDMTAVHPESYPVVEKIAGSMEVTVEELIQRPELAEKVKIEGFKTETAGIFTLGDIKEELRKPGRDPREKFVAPKFREGVKEMKDVTTGMTLEGVVTNVTKFGAFVDIGVHQDGLVHVSEISHRFITEPGEALKAGQIVKVQVLSVDLKAKRIALSIKALEPKPKAAGGRPPQAPQTRNEPSMQDKLAALSSKFRTR